MTELDRRPPLSPLVWAVAAAVAALLLSTAGRYGIFRDEFYYLMCADHPAWGYVDHPPLAMFFLTMWKGVCGDSVLALRVPPALLVGATSLGAGMLAREMRGTKAAQALAAVTVGLMPGVIALGCFYSMNAFDVAFWMLAAWIVCRLLDPAVDRRWWWALGVSLGLGLLNKYSIVFLGAGLGVGILLSPLRRELLSHQRLVGSALVLVIVLPHLVWQAHNGWPTLEFIRNAHSIKNVALGPAAFWGEQLLFAHPGFLIVWLGGVAGLLVLPRLRPWRPLGVAFVVVALWLTAQQAKPYYMVPAYPLVMAAGAVAITQLLARFRRVARVTTIVLPLLCVVQGLVIAPLAIPLLPPAEYVAWEQTLGLRPSDQEFEGTGVLPQHFADRFGWEELARTVHDVAADLAPDERAACLVVTGNYGECGAINYWGLPEGVRPAVSGHNSCHTWWPADFEPAVVIVVGGSRERAEHYFDTVELAAVSEHELAMPYEQEIRIWVCRKPRMSAAEARAALRFAI